ncbi:MAG: hypothetical protein ACRDGD_03705 [Candidatus Limnocylindria bacterium]
MTVTSDPSAAHPGEPVWPEEPPAPPIPPAALPTIAEPPGIDGAQAGLPIGRLHHVDPVELWRSAALASWLGENLDEIGRLIGVALSAAPVGAASPGTVVATDPDGAQARVVVELGPSSDETFGVLMRQLVASGAKTAVWVCSRAQDEHLTSVEWLNREISGRLHVVVVEAVRIDDSVPAPIFRLALRSEDGKPAVSGS